MRLRNRKTKLERERGRERGRERTRGREEDLFKHSIRKIKERERECV